MYHVDCLTNREDSIKAFTNLIMRGHQRFYVADIPVSQKAVKFRLCLPELLRYGIPANLMSPSHTIYDSERNYYVDRGLTLGRRDQNVDPQWTLIISDITIIWDSILERFVVNKLYNNYPSEEIGEILRCSGFPHELFMSYPELFIQPKNNKYIFETASDIWK